MPFSYPSSMEGFLYQQNILIKDFASFAKEGMEFIIYQLSDPVLDPETQEQLGRLELHKGRIKVVHVQDKLSTARTLIRKVYRTSSVQPPSARLPAVKNCRRPSPLPFEIVSIRLPPKEPALVCSLHLTVQQCPREE